MIDPDEALRTACIMELRRLTELYVYDIPYRDVLERGFPHAGKSVPFLTPYKGIFRARAQRLAAALSINTSTRSPYRDRATADGWVYSYRSGDVEQPDKRRSAPRTSCQTPIVYFHATAPGYYRPLFPWYIDADDPVEGEVHVTPGRYIGFGSAPTPTTIEDPIERQYVFRKTRWRPPGSVSAPRSPALRHKVRDLLAQGGATAGRGAHHRRCGGSR